MPPFEVHLDPLELDGNLVPEAIEPASCVEVAQGHLPALRARPYARSRPPSPRIQGSVARCWRSGARCASTSFPGWTPSRAGGQSSRAGCVLDALERLDRKPTAREDVADLVSAVDRSLQSRQPSAGLGEYCG
jgi:hypothetical protein